MKTEEGVENDLTEKEIEEKGAFRSFIAKFMNPKMPDTTSIQRMDTEGDELLSPDKSEEKGAPNRYITPVHS